MRRPILALLLAAPFWLAGCDMLGMESASVVAARREADGKAVGAGCRHAARSVEQCYEQNKRAEKAAIFAGWKEMNDYMRENKIEPVPSPAEPVTEVAAAATEVAEAGAKKAGKPDAKPVAKKH
jgi:hypothetical protein